MRIFRLHVAEISDLAERLRLALGRRLTPEEYEFFLLAEKAYLAEEQACQKPKDKAA